MNLALYFLIAFVLSFLGTLPIGMITLTITQKTILNGRRSGLLIALGATVMEFAYTYIALISLDFFTQNSTVGDYIKIAAIIIFLILGIYYLVKKSVATEAPKPTSYNYFDFIRGIVVGTMNLLIVPFWVFLGLWLISNGVRFDEHFYIFIFSLGAGAGALLAFWGYILMSEYVEKKSALINQYTNKAVGVLFLGLGMFQLWSYL